MSAPMLSDLADLIASKLTAAPVTKTITFGELYHLYFEKRVKVRLKNHANAHYFYTVHGPRWAAMQIHEIKRPDVQAWVDSLGRKSPSAAWRALAMMRAIINWGMKRDYLPSMANPCTGVESFQPLERDRFLMPSELARFDAALRQEPRLIRDFFRLSLLTGARKGNVLAMRWDEIDFDLATWVIPGKKFKNGKTHVIPLSDRAVAILQDRYKASDGLPWVFPGKAQGDHLKEPKRAWKRVLDRAGIDDLHLHDLRRSMGSYMAMQGQSLLVIGKMLGHKDGRSTAVYARFDLTLVRKAAQSVSEAWEKLESIPVFDEDYSKDSKSSKVEQPPLLIPKNANIRLSAADQIRVEALILTCLNMRLTTKKDFYRKIGGRFQLNSSELERVLNSMAARGLIERHESDNGALTYALALGEPGGE
ncbi:MAG: site-specific integrase [Cyanobacteria bacterium REEB67]|nr:site-specific integrase [Cyanobacteria bacterium REEB67]